MKSILCVLGLLVASVCLANVIRVPEEISTLQSAIYSSALNDTITIHEAYGDAATIYIDRSLSIFSRDLFDDDINRPYINNLRLSTEQNIDVSIVGLRVFSMAFYQNSNMGSDFNISNVLCESVILNNCNGSIENYHPFNNHSSLLLSGGSFHVFDCLLNGSIGSQALNVSNSTARLSHVFVHGVEIISNIPMVTIHHSNCEFVNLTFMSWDVRYNRAAIEIESTSSVIVTNTIFYRLFMNSIKLGSTYDNNNSLTIDYSVLYQSPTYEQYGSVIYLPHTLYLDPSLGADGTIDWLSPCIDAGDPSSPLDPDGTRADIGAYYFCQGDGIRLPDVLRTSAEPSYPEQLTATLQSTCDAVVIDSARTTTGLFTLNSYPSQVAGEFKSGDFQLTFHPSVQGVFTDTLHIWANTDPPHHMVPLVGEAGPIPGPVTDLAIQILPDQSAQLTWSPVTETIYGNPVLPDYYLIYYNQLDPQVEDLWYYLTPVVAPGYTHQLVARFEDLMNYRVIAYKGINPTQLGIESGMAWPEVQQRLTREDR